MSVQDLITSIILHVFTKFQFCLKETKFSDLYHEFENLKPKFKYFLLQSLQQDFNFIECILSFYQTQLLRTIFSFHQ